MNEEINVKNIQVENQPTFSKVLDLFIAHIESLATSLPLVLQTIEVSKERASKLHQEFLSKDCEKKVDNGDVYYIIKPEHLRRNNLLRKEVVKSNISYKLIQCNYIVSLVSQFDSLIGSLIRTMFYYNPDLLNESEKQMTFSNLVQFPDILSAREYIIEKEIESVLRESHSFHFKWVEGKIKCQLRKDLQIWATFIELTERRNLYVHTDGNVSNQYLKVCKENNVKFINDPKLGDFLEIDREYFENSFKCLFELGVKLTQVMWRRIIPKEIKSADLNFLKITFELIQNSQYDLALEILDFGDKYIKKISSEDLKLRLLLNRAQTYKWLGKNEKCLEIINSVDWSAYSSIFKLASYVLKDDYEAAVEIMKVIGNNPKEIGQNDYKEWPIFREFRKQEIFEKTYEEIYKERLEKKERFASSGFKIIDSIVFLEKLDECLKEAQNRPNGFVSSKFIIENYLANRGYDIGFSWELFKKLEVDGIIETYRFSDPLGKFPPISAVRRKHIE